jgi:hypothetical protein
VGVVAYLVIVYLLRHRRVRSLQKRFGLTSGASFARMTTIDAQATLRDLTELEFPTVFGFSIIFALFKGGDSNYTELTANVIDRPMAFRESPYFLSPLAS